MSAPVPSYPPPMFPAQPMDHDVDMGFPEIDDAQLMEQLGQTDLVDEGPTPEEIRLLLQQEFQRMLEEAQRETRFGDEASDRFVGDDLPKDFEEEEDDECWDRSALAHSEYRPYPNKTAMLLDVMDNLPRCRFSSTQMSMVIHFAKQLGAPEVPSLKAFRKMQQTLQSTCGNKPIKITSQFGNVFYMNDIRQTLARDMANPLVAPHMHFYPEETDGPISETYQAERWMEYTPSQLTPMFSKGHKRFWIEELAQLKDGTFIIPHTLIVRNGVLTSDVSIATQTSDGRWELLDQEQTVKADDFELDYNDLIAHFGMLVWVEGAQASPMPNEMRKLVAEDEDLFVIMTSPWADDVSGNKSKQYNKHMNMYTGNGCLPGRLLQQEYHVHYISTSPNASSAEQFSTFRDHVKITEKEPVRCYNAATNRICRFIIRTPGLPADNPQQSEEASHMGCNSNFPCRKCQWGGTQIEKEMEEIYHQCHFAGIARDAAKIRQGLEEQLRLSMLGDPKAVTEHQRATGTKDKSPSLDPSQDTPVELLHTILLGVIKYIWHHLNTNQWSNEDRHLLAIRLQSTDLTGLTVPPVRAGYMIQYKNNLIGKHFKTLMQILAFHVHGISTPEQFALIKAAGDLGARLWIPEIDNMDEYLEDLKIAIATCLMHSTRWTRNGFWSKLSSISWRIYQMTNRLAPSRDIAVKFASMDRVKHFLSGGYWWDPIFERWAQAGWGVQQILLTDPTFQRHLGWTPPPKINPGSVKAMPGGKTPPVKWSQTKASAHWTTNTAPPSPDSQWRMGQAVTAQSGDKAIVGSWVFGLDSKGDTVIGRVAELLVGEKMLATLEQFICTDRGHPEFGWPVIRRPNGAEITGGRGQSHVVLEAKSVHMTVVWETASQASVIRSAKNAKKTNWETMLIKHADDDQFVLNMSALHNFAKLRRHPNKKAKEDRRKRRATAAAKRQEAELAATAAAEAEAALRRAEEGEESENSEEEPETNQEEGPHDEEEEEEEEEENTEQRGKKRRRR
ncbi:hypothetical protein B0H14DRAFT_3546391 [Mycena olivaceomarginata]|nr:hypothetical protein B0H14DRAFT_3546391 [Mycena olivaceomarginata]